MQNRDLGEREDMDDAGVIREDYWGMFWRREGQRA